MLRKTVLWLAVIAFYFPAAVGNAQTNQPPGQPQASTQVTRVVPAPVELLPATLAGVKATSEKRAVALDSLTSLVGEQAAVLREFRLTAVQSRTYGAARIEVVETKNHFAAFGLFSHYSQAKAGAQSLPVGSMGERLADGVMFYKGNVFVRVFDNPQTSKNSNPALSVRLAQAVAEHIRNEASERPPLVDNFASATALAESHRLSPAWRSVKYLLGPQSLSAHFEHGREMFEFFGEAEAAVIAYHSHDAKSGQPAKLLIVEYHTPQFATDAWQQATAYRDALPAAEQDRLILKRVGNYLVGAMNFADRDLAEQLTRAIEYPYSVKWLRNPLLSTNDPFRQQKVAHMLVSSFGILGLIFLTVFIGGSIFGAFIFIKRRKLQQAIFSDAGGMLRLEIDPFERTLLGLPAAPKRTEE